MDNPLTSLQQIFSTLNLNFDKRYLNAFYSRSQTRKTGKMSNKSLDPSSQDFYFSVFRPKSFEHDHWKDQMNPEVILFDRCYSKFFKFKNFLQNFFLLFFQDLIHVEEACHDLILKLNYNLTKKLNCQNLISSFIHSYLFVIKQIVILWQTKTFDYFIINIVLNHFKHFYFAK